MLVLPSIPLEPPTTVTFVKGEYIVVKCRSDPTNADSLTYELPIPYFRSGTPEVYLKWLANARKAYVGKNCQSGPEKFGMFKRLLEGEAKAVFSMAASAVAEDDFAGLSQAEVVAKGAAALCAGDNEGIVIVFQRANGQASLRKWKNSAEGGTARSKEAQLLRDCHAICRDLASQEKLDGRIVEMVNTLRSVAEAETIRRVLHAHEERSLIEGATTTVALRNVTLAGATGNEPLDSSHAFEEGPQFQRSQAIQLSRFIDGQMMYEPQELSVLLKATQLSF